MKLVLPALATLLLSSHVYAQGNLKTLPYPQTKKVDTVTTYFSTKVADPYRWLEDDQSTETKAWVQEQNKVTQNYLSPDSLPRRYPQAPRNAVELREIQRPF